MVSYFLFFLRMCNKVLLQERDQTVRSCISSFYYSYRFAISCIECFQIRHISMCKSLKLKQNKLFFVSNDCEDESLLMGRRKRTWAHLVEELLNPKTVIWLLIRLTYRCWPTARFLVFDHSSTDRHMINHFGATSLQVMLLNEDSNDIYRQKLVLLL